MSTYSVAELRPVAPLPCQTPPAAYAWLRTRRQDRKPVWLTSVELLDQLFEDLEA
jgi:hypothetical protein